MELDTTAVSKQLLKTLSGEFDVESIRFINLSGLNIESVGIISECTCLEKLDLSKNNLCDLKPLSQLKQLSYLNLAANSISSIDSLADLENLKILNLAGNLIRSSDRLQCITQLPSLESLRLQDPIKEFINPICHNAFYRKTILAMFPNLKLLDGERVTGRGSDVYRLLHDLEKDLYETDRSNGGLCTSSKSWVQREFWNNNKTQEGSADEAEKNLRELLKECNTLSSTASR